MKLLVRPNSTRGKLMLTLNDGTLIPNQLYTNLQVVENLERVITCQFNFFTDWRLTDSVRLDEKTKELFYDDKLLDVAEFTMSKPNPTQARYAIVLCYIEHIDVDFDLNPK